MNNRLSRRTFLGNAGAAAAVPSCLNLLPGTTHKAVSFGDAAQPFPETSDRIVDMHGHFDEKNPNFISDLLKLSDRLNLTACVLTPFANRRVVLDAAKQHPSQIIPFGFVDLDAPDVVKQVEELHSMGYRGLGEMEFVKKPYNDPSYFPVYELANHYGWIVFFHTGIVLRRKFDEPEDVASGRTRPIYLEEMPGGFTKSLCWALIAGIPSMNGLPKSLDGIRMCSGTSAVPRSRKCRRAWRIFRKSSGGRTRNGRARSGRQRKQTATRARL